MNRTADFAALSSLLLDYFCVLAVVVYLGTVLVSGSTEYLIVGSAIAGAAALTWMWWRATRSRLAVLVFLLPAVALQIVSTSGSGILMAWLSTILVFFTFGQRAAPAYVVFLCCVVVIAHAASGNSLYLIVAEGGYALIIGFTGLVLARLLQRGYHAERERHKAVEQLQVALRDSHELTLAHERERVASSLHDGLGHRLTSLGLSLDYAARILERDPAKAREEIALARQSTSDALNSMRTTVRAMNPPTSCDTNLVSTLDQLAVSFANTDLDVTFTASCPAELTKEQSSLALLFVQEALTNVVHHAEADRVEITFNNSTLTVADNGKGNDAPANFGLSSLQSRAAAGHAIVDKQPHGGIAGGFRISLTFSERL